MEAVRYTDLSLLYKLFTRFKNGLHLVSKAFADYIKVYTCIMYIINTLYVQGTCTSIMYNVHCTVIYMYIAIVIVDY